MVTLGLVCRSYPFRFLVLTLVAMTGLACATVDGGRRWVATSRNVEDQVLPDAEQMIDDLDRIMTANGTIGVKSPDVWGQDRLAKFRSEYETQMSEWLKTSFKGDINAVVRRSESEARRLYLGASPSDPAVKPASETNAAAAGTNTAAPNTATKPTATAEANAAAAAASPAEKGPAVLEPTVVLDEHSSYLNHLNQLRRINAGDDLTDRPGYGLYLVRIPVTLSPGPKSRRGKGAIITVSAKSLMTRDTLRNTLRNAVINETVNNLTQAVAARTHDQSEPATGSAAGMFALVSFADTEIIYGRSHVSLLRGEAERQLGRELTDEPYHRSARIAEWLRGELEASYHLLEEAAMPARSGKRVAAFDPLEEVGELLLRRDFVRLAQLQASSMKDAQVMLASGRCSEARDASVDPAAVRRQVSDFLGFALRIQAAAVSRRLKQDMVDQDPAIKSEELKLLSFFDPDASEPALRHFEKYVNAKWPLRVYAIEPVIAQQNVADAFGRRTQTALDLAASAPAASLKVLGNLASVGFVSDRRAAEDETAIRLNPTMVGFGAGESTFGWVFYPRIQTRSRDGRLLTDLALLLNGRFPDPTGKEQSIEPGQRECTALIVMPNFVPKIEFVTVANWFRTSEVGDGQKSELEKASILARKLAVAENALSRAEKEGQFRPEEYRIAVERLSQIKSMMPTQRLQVSVPYTADNNDSRIFCSQGGQLRPLLLAWHGRPPREGEESTVLIEGKNFSVHDTHVIAGGKPAKAVLVSRNVMEITIAKEASPTPGGDGQPLLDLSVATPNGVSNHLLLKMTPPRADRAEVSDDWSSDSDKERPMSKDHPAEKDEAAAKDGSGSVENHGSTEVSHDRAVEVGHREIVRKVKSELGGEK